MPILMITLTIIMNMCILTCISITHIIVGTVIYVMVSNHLIIMLDLIGLLVIFSIRIILLVLLIIIRLVVLGAV